jgi:hypothetical protein
VTRECGLCGTWGPDVTTMLVEWAEPLNGRRWDTIDRCRDSVACRARAEAAGARWQVRDATEPRTAAAGHGGQDA